MNVKFQWATPEAEYQIAFIARGSNPPNQDNPEYRKLFEYCLVKHKVPHWSPFQMADMCLQFETSLAVAGQVQRHWSMAIHEPMDIQQTSMRYMDPFEHGWELQPIEFRKTAKSNRQSSNELLSKNEQLLADGIVRALQNDMISARETLKRMGVANETLRMLYPQTTTTRFFIKGSCRSWIHYFMQRLEEHAQLEHRQLAQAAYKEFKNVFPTVADICEKASWFDLSEMENTENDAGI